MIAHELIEKSALSKEDKDFWFRQIETIAEEHVEILVNFFKNFPDKATWLTSIQKRKIRAFAEGNTEEWKKILSEEEQEFNKVLAEEEKSAKLAQVRSNLNNKE